MEYGKTTKERQSSVLGNMRDMFGKYICSSYDDDYGVFFNRLTDKLRSGGAIPKTYKVTDIWYTDGRLTKLDKVSADGAYLEISACGKGYEKLTLTSLNDKSADKQVLNEYTLSCVLDECQRLMDEMRAVISERNNIAKAGGVMDMFLQYAKKHVNNDVYDVALEKGSLNRERGDDRYECVVVRKKDGGSYLSSFKFGRNNNGKYTITQRSPLCGERTLSFTLDEAEDTIEQLLNF